MRLFSILFACLTGVCVLTNWSWRLEAQGTTDTALNDHDYHGDAANTTGYDHPDPNPAGSHHCDLFNGFWDIEKFQWWPYQCQLERLFSHIPDRDSYMLFIGDSNDENLISDVAKVFYDGVQKCGRKPMNSIADYFQCSLKSMHLLKAAVLSAFPYPNSTLNYCIQYQNRSAADRQFHMSNTIVVDKALEKFTSVFRRKPQLISFSLNFWEMVRVREEANCGNPSKRAQAAAKRRWSRLCLDKAFLDSWQHHIVGTLRYIKQRALESTPPSIVVVKTFQRPLLNNDQRANHSNLHTGCSIRQLNAVMRSAAGKVGIEVLDIERMTDFFDRPTLYLRDALHYNSKVSYEIFNILQNYLKYPNIATF